MTSNGNLANAFREFDDANPEVYESLKGLCDNWLNRRGDEPVGIGMLWEVMRWNMALRTQGADPYKLNNNHRAFYARKLMAHNAKYKGLFSTRGRAVSACACSRCFR